MSTSKPDPRVQRTKSLLVAELFELIQVQRWDKIRVQDILDSTGVSRSAFYAHYDNKFDLLTASIPELTVPFRQPGTDTLDLGPLFEHVDEMAHILRPLLTQPVLGEIAALFHQSLVQGWKEHLEYRGTDDDGVLTEFLAGALAAVLKSYINTKDRGPAREIAGVFVGYADLVMSD